MKGKKSLHNDWEKNETNKKRTINKTNNHRKKARKKEGGQQTRNKERKKEGSTQVKKEAFKGTEKEEKRSLND